MWHIPKMSANHSQERREVRKTSRESGRAAGKKIHTSMLGSNGCSTKLRIPVQAWLCWLSLKWRGDVFR